MYSYLHLKLYLFVHSGLYMVFYLFLKVFFFPVMHKVLY